MFIAAMPGGPDEATERDDFARVSFSQIAGIKDVHLQDAGPLRIANGPGYQMLAKAKDSGAGTDVMVVADHVAGLHNLYDAVSRDRGVGNFEHRLVQIGIELFALRRELPHAVLLQCLQKFALRQFDAVDERLDAALRVVAQFGRHRFQGAAHIVGHHQQVAGKRGHAV